MRPTLRLIWCLLGTLVFVPGCAVLPHPPMLERGIEIPEKATHALQSGVSTRQDVLLTLGRPTRTEADERYYFYLWNTSTMTFAMGYPPATLDNEIPTDKWFVCMEFSSDGRLRRQQRFKQGLFSPSQDETLKAWMIEPAAQTAGGKP